MKEEEKKKEKPLGVISADSYLPEDFDMKVEIYSYRFWLMCKLRSPNSEVLTKRHDTYLTELRKKLMDVNSDKRISDRVINRVINSAYNTIPGEFWTNLERHIKIAEPKSTIPDRSYKIVKEKIDNDVAFRDGVYIPLKRNKKKHKK